jgi:hypothetical protein
MHGIDEITTERVTVGKMGKKKYHVTMTRCNDIGKLKLRNIGMEKSSLVHIQGVKSDNIIPIGRIGRKNFATKHVICSSPCECLNKPQFLVKYIYYKNICQCPSLLCTTVMVTSLYHYSYGEF